MLPKRIIDEFVNLPRDSWDLIKKWSPEKTDFKLRELFTKTKKGSPFKENPPPLLHQKQCFYLGVFNSGFCFFLDTGVGKTRLFLDKFNWRVKMGHAKYALVLLKNKKNVDDWLSEYKKFVPDLKMCGITEDLVSKHKKILILKRDYDILAMTYAAFARYCSVPKKTRKSKHPNATLDLDAQNRLFGHIDFLGLDEVSYVRNYSTVIYKTLRPLADRIKFKYCYSATPTGKDPVGYWTQFRLMDGGETFGKSPGAFLEYFYRIKIRTLYVKGRRFEKIEREFKQEKMEELKKMMKNKSIFYSKSECYEEPKVKRIPKFIHLAPDNAKLAREMLHDFVQAKKNNKEEDLPTNFFIKMRQAASGFQVLNPGEVKKEYFDFKQNARIDTVVSLLEDIPKEYKVAIVYHFVHSGDLISERLKKEGISFVNLKERGSLHKFKNDATIQVMLFNYDSGSFGLNLQYANYMIMYETPSSPDIRKQVEDRILRQGQKNKCFIYDIIAKNTWDERILDCLEKRMDFMKALLRGDDTIMKSIINHGK